MADVDDSAHSVENMSIERTLAQRIHAFSNMISGHFYRRTEQPLGVSLPEWRVLRSVINRPGTSQGEIAAYEGLNVMNVSRAVAGLRRKKLVDAEPDPDDRRRTMLSATEIGDAIAADIGARETMVYQHVFSVLSRDEVEHLGELLDRVNEVLRTTELPPPPAPSRDWAVVLDQERAND